MMRRHSSNPYPVSGRFFRGGEFMRMMSMIVMLFVLFTMITRLRNNPNMLAWLLRDHGEDAQIMRHAPAGDALAGTASAAQAANPQPAPSPSAPSANDAAAPTTAASGSAALPDESFLDQDPEEREAIREEFQVVTDGRFARQVIEMAAYLRLVRWARAQTWEQMLVRAGKGFVYNDFVQSPERFRGKLLTMKLDARRVLPCPEVTDPEDPEKKLVLYEVWGSTKESRSFPYVFVVLDLPEGMAYGPEVQENVRVTGYFFGLQGYYSSFSKPGSAPLRAPLFIGRLEWIKPQPVELNSTDWNILWGAGGAAVLIAVGTLGYMAFRARSGPPRLAGDRVAPAKVSMDEWLNQAEVGDAPVDLGPNDYEDYGANHPRGAPTGGPQAAGGAADEVLRN